MSDAVTVRLEQHKRIKRRTPEKHRKYETHLKRCTVPISFVTEDILFIGFYYDVDEYLQGSAPSLPDNATQPNSNTDNLCDICWCAERES